MNVTVIYIILVSLSWCNDEYGSVDMNDQDNDKYGSVDINDTW